MWLFLGAALAIVGSVWITQGILQPNDVDVALGGLWWLLAAGDFLLALQYRRREQRGYGQGSPDAAADVMTLVSQGEKIRAIKRYRELNPGISLREAKTSLTELTIKRQRSK